jgi:LAGLIDADG endonuclease
VESDNPSGADNQQERPDFAQWVVGFVDGEGCFSVPLFRNSTCQCGWQVQPTFSVVQGERSVAALQRMQAFFDCGHVGRNIRHDNHLEPLCWFRLRGLRDLRFRVVPFFEEHPLVTAKASDFQTFARVVRMMEKGVHRTPEGLSHIAYMTERMNRRQPSRFLESSEAIRQPLATTSEVKIWS